MITNTPHISSFQNGNGELEHMPEPLPAEFYSHDETGEPHIRIFVDDKTTFECAVEEEHRVRYGMQWAAFTGDSDPYADKIRLEQAGWINAPAVRALRSRRIHTLEQLANANDETLSKTRHPDVLEMREKARQIIRRRAATEGVDTLVAENADLKARLEKLEDAILAKAEEAPATKTAKPRKPKVAAQASIEKDDAQA